MKHPALMTGLLMLAVAWALHGVGSDDEYVRIYNLIQQADSLREGGQGRSSAEKYLEAQAALKEMQKSQPAWNPQLVEFRLRYVAEKLKASSVEAEPVAPQRAEKPSTPSEVPDRLTEQIKAFEAQIRQMEVDRELLQAKLKQALSAQPAAVDPRELAKAEEKIQSLEKEIQVLKVNLQKSEARPDKPVDPSVLDQTQKALAAAEQKLAQQGERMVSLNLEKQALQNRLRTFMEEGEVKALRDQDPSSKQQAGELRAIAPAPAGIEEVRRQLADLQTELAAQKSRNEVLQAEKKLLEGRLNELALPREAITTAKTRALEKELAEVKSVIRSNAVVGSTLQASLRTVQEAKALGEKERHQLEAKLSSALAALAAADGYSEGSKRSEANKVKRLERERDQLRQKLDVATRQLSDNKKATRAANVKQLTNQLAVLHARLEALEARKVPYTAEELALLRMPDLKPVKGGPETRRTSTNALPADAGPLVAEAEKAFAARRLDEAEQRYRQVLQFDDGNGVVLANLAAVQMQQNRLSEAEVNLKNALAADPDDAFSLSLLGVISVRREKFDEAIGLLSRAAQLDPKNPDTHNYLGIALVEKGLPGPAEAAFRRAIQLSPNNAGAHHNLSVVYATQIPPSVELARWHYQKALNAGHPKNPGLEKTLNGDKSDSVAR
jgi:Tfp pilus assembly protein PilF